MDGIFFEMKETCLQSLGDLFSFPAGFFTLGVGKLFGVESFNLGKLGAVLMR